MLTLYDALHIPDPKAEAGAQVDPWPEHMTGREFAERVIQSKEFRQYILSGIIAGTLPQAVMCRILDHGWGQPVKRLEVDDRRDLTALTKDKLIERIEFMKSLVQELPDDVLKSSIH